MINKDKNKKEKFYIATAIAYSSKQPHIGNDIDPVYADVIARFKRMSGYDVFFSTGTDEHGQKIEEIAKEAGITPKESADRITGMIYDTYRRLNISFDKFIRTTDEHHKESVKKIFVKLYENGDIYKSHYEGPYCVPCESFFTPSQVKDSGGLCPDCGGKLQEAKEDAYKFKMSKYQERLEKHIEQYPDFISPVQRKREILNNFIKPGIQDLCVSRSTVKWGVPVEFDPGHVIYVWIDALSNYITTLGYNPANEEQPELFNRYWPCDVQMIGKDITRFHAIYWTVMLWGLGLEAPKQILGHPWLLFNDEKMSKSIGNVVYSDSMIEKFGADAVRYYLMSEMPFDKDFSFTYANFIKIYNAELVNTLSNLVNRTVAMAEKYFDGTIPEIKNIRKNELDEDLKETVISRVGNYAALMNEYKISEAIDEIIAILNRANKYIDETEPWKLSKDENKKERLEAVLYNLLESIRIAGILLSPIIPETSEKIFAQINTDVTGYETAFEFGGLKSGIKLNKAEPIFMRLDEAKILAELETEGHGATQKNPESKPEIESEKIPEIAFEDFMKINLRIGLVLECEKAEKSDKLLKLQVDLGDEKRQIVSGIAKFYNPDDLIGRKVIIVSNLKEAKIRGIESKGMLLACGEEKDEGGVKVIFAPDDAVIGSRVR